MGFSDHRMDPDCDRDSDLTPVWKGTAWVILYMIKDHTCRVLSVSSHSELTDLSPWCFTLSLLDLFRKKLRPTTKWSPRSAMTSWRTWTSRTWLSSCAATTAERLWSWRGPSPEWTLAEKLSSEWLSHLFLSVYSYVLQWKLECGDALNACLVR